MLLHGYATLTIDAVWDAFQRVITVVIKTLFGLVLNTLSAPKASSPAILRRKGDRLIVFHGNVGSSSQL